MLIKTKLDYIIAANPYTGKIKRYRPLTEKYGEEKAKKKIMRHSHLGVLNRAFNNAPIIGLDTKDRYEFRSAISEASKSCKYLIVYGGDGTFSDAANSDLDPNVILVPYPGGSGNAFSYSFRISKDIKEFKEMTEKGVIIEPNLIYCKTDKIEQYCLFASLGIEGDVLVLREKMKKQNLNGFFAYTISSGKAFVTHRLKKVNLRINEKEILNDLNLTVICGIIKHFGYGLVAIPNADPTKGKIYVNPIANRIEALQVLPKAALGLYKDECISGKVVEITSKRKQRVQVDGDIMGLTDKLRLEVSDKRIKVLIGNRQ